MNCSLRLRTWCAALVFAATALGGCFALSGRAEQPEGAAVQPPSGGPARTLAPGVMQSVDPHLREAETLSRKDVVELAEFDWAKDVRFRREIWGLEFRFKVPRMIWIDVPQPDLHMKRKLIWYMVYSVTNPGKVMPWVQAADGTMQLQDSDKPRLCVLEFLLESPEFGKVYRDRLIPIAVGAIQMREDPNQRFHNTVEMVRNVKVGETVWGVATWEDVDPRIDRFSIHVGGLTNAYQWEDPPGPFPPDAPIGKGRTFTRKTLKLNFWRPGDDLYENEKEFRYGGIPDEVDYEWVYR